MGSDFQRRAVLGAAGTLMAGLGLRNSPARAQALQGPEAITPLPPTPLPDLAFTTLEGSPVTLGAFRGRPVVLNFWATWCIPCVAELPELDALAADPGITVLAASADHGGAAVVRPFLAKRSLPHLHVLLDPGTSSGHKMDIFEFPATLIVDAQGRLRARLAGPAHWGAAGGRIREVTK